MEWIKSANADHKDQHEILSFNDYCNILKKDPAKELRATYEYLIDMLKHFGEDKDENYKLLDIDHYDAHPVYGQKQTLESIKQNLINFCEEGYNNKFLLLVGPNGSAKSSLIRKLMKGTEEYSSTSDGALYSFSWIFPIDNYVKGHLGLTSKPSTTDLQSYAYLEDKDIAAILASELKDHPILLIPKKERQKIITEMFKNNPKKLERIKRSYFFHGDISKRNRMIYDALLNSYKGDHTEVLKHIRVERFRISKRYSIGAVTIEPQLHVDAHMQQITMDKRLAGLPPSLQCLNLYSMSGEVVLANRGILEFSDLLKRPMDTYKYLLTTMETGAINLHGILTELDIFFIGSSNEVHLDAFKQHPDFKSFKGRFNFIKVPYLLNYQEEQKIYQKQLDGLKDKSIFEPHSIEMLAMFAVMTRLRAPIGINYTGDEKMSLAATSLNPLEKALFIADKTTPEKLNIESKQLLMMNFKDILSEFENDMVYEGKFGMSPRDLQKIIYKLAASSKNITFIDALEYLSRFITKAQEYDFLNMVPQGDYHNPSRFVALLKEYLLNIFDKEVRESLGMVDNRSYEDYIKRYVENIKALVKGEKIKNEVTQKFEQADDFFIKEFESSIRLEDDPITYRSQILSKLGAYYLDNPQKKIIYCKVFPDVIHRLKETFQEEQTKVLKNIADSLIYFEAEQNEHDIAGKKMNTPLSEDNRKKITKLVNNLVNDFHYTKMGALSLLKYLIKHKY